VFQKRYRRIVVDQGWRYRYVGPADLSAQASLGAGGQLIRSRKEFDDWIGAVDTREIAEPFTYVVDVEGVLRLAPRRSEHVACAVGGEVLAAGEIAFARSAAGWVVSEVSNQSTGYCPDLSCWSAIASALDRAGLQRPDGFTSEFVFRRCPDCFYLNVVKEEDFVCCLCGEDLPDVWNVDPGSDPAAS
jgi:hypothetical protein